MGLIRYQVACLSYLLGHLAVYHAYSQPIDPLICEHDIVLMIFHGTSAGLPFSPDNMCDCAVPHRD